MSFVIETILEDEGIDVYLQKRSLTKQYKKAKEKILQGYFTGPKLKQLEPKSAEVFSFRINKQFRALCKLTEGSLIVFDIDNHQYL